LKVIEVTLSDAAEAESASRLKALRLGPPAQEIVMKKLLAIAALLLASTAAQAQYTFEYGGRTIRVDPDRGTVHIPGVYDNTGRKAKRSKNDDADQPAKPKSQQAKTDPNAQPDTPAAAPVPAAPPPAPAAALPPVPPPSTDPATATAAVAPVDSSVPPPPIQQDAAPPPAPAPTVAAVPPAAPLAAAPLPPKPAAPAPAQMANLNSPLGVWLTEEKEGKVRIEQCGGNLCGYAVDKKSNQNGEQVLINMKPGKDAKWSGRILDPNSGSTYDSTIAMKGTDTLRVQGCAFGGMFCGGQTWTRVN
jgi:uncharacterized protein (DUF2147 family)